MRLGAKLRLDALNISLGDCCCVRQVSLLLCSLLSQNVTFEGVLSLDLSTSREFETLLGASFGFHLRHGLGFYDWLFFLRIEKNGHSLSLEPWQLFNCSVLFEFLGKLQKQDFTSLLEDDGPSSEEYISFELRAFFQKLLGVNAVGRPVRRPASVD